MPPVIKGWNWGAFLLGWLWATGNGVMTGFIIGTAGWVISWVPSPHNETNWIFYSIELINCILMGVKGSEWSWKSKYKKWNSVEHFKETQEKWRTWGFISVTLAPVLFLIIELSGCIKR
jgi:hypothetical protein